jgi:ADP-heptose:LPS heptosyltransferase
MTTSITVDTVQGIGDIFWVYQKLAPYFERINLNILVVDHRPVQHRSERFCQLLPQVDKVRFVQVPGRQYMQVAQARYLMRDVITNHLSGPQPYAVNAPLEVGINLRDIDPGYEVESFVDMGLPREVAREDYLCVFVAGAKSGTVWKPARWSPVIHNLARRLGTSKVRLIGAAWDTEVQAEIHQHCKALDVRSHVGADLVDTIDIIRRSRFFLGYQSGLNVLAENYDVPQLMVYFAKLAPMLYTWCKPSSVRTTFHATTFADDVERVVESLPL